MRIKFHIEFREIRFYCVYTLNNIERQQVKPGNVIMKFTRHHFLLPPVLINITVSKQLNETALNIRNVFISSSHFKTEWWPPTVLMEVWR